MNIKIRKKLHKVLDLCFDAKDLGHDCFFRYSPHVSSFNLEIHVDGYIEEKYENFRTSFYLDKEDAETKLDEVIEYLEKLIDESVFGKKVAKINKEKYALTYTHKGIDIYTLKISDPKKDSLGYVVDHEWFERHYNTLGEATAAIDLLF